MDESLRQLVRRRAGERCEYCHLPQDGHEERFSIDHIIARKHGGDDSPANLALCCLRCNLHKGTDLTCVDPSDGQVVTVFHPRRQNWSEHFQWNGPILEGKTPIGRATVEMLRMNAPERIQLRQALIALGILTRG